LLQATVCRGRAGGLGDDCGSGDGDAGSSNPGGDLGDELLAHGVGSPWSILMSAWVNVRIEQLVG
jgi:hypothetical protein